MKSKEKIQVPIRISKEQHQRFAAISKKTGIPMSVMARNALEQYITDIEKKNLYN